MTARLPAWELNRRQRCDLELLATGGFSPLRSFLDRADYESVCASMRLVHRRSCGRPDHARRARGRRRTGGPLRRCGPACPRCRRGRALADHGVAAGPAAEAAAVLGTTDPAHPGVRVLLEETHPWYVSGRLDVLRLPAHAAFRTLRHDAGPGPVAHRGARMERVVAFQTRNPMHRAHQELTLRAARLDAKLLLHPVVGVTKPGDVAPDVRVGCYRALLPTYPPDASCCRCCRSRCGWPARVRRCGTRSSARTTGPPTSSWGATTPGPGPTVPVAGSTSPTRPRTWCAGTNGNSASGSSRSARWSTCRRCGATYPTRRSARAAPAADLGDGATPAARAGEELPSWFTPPEVAAQLRLSFPRAGGGR